MLNARLPCGEVPLESVARPLSRLLEVPEAHSVAWRLDVARQVCRALAVLHRTGGAHGSFGPRNVWVDMEGHVSIMEVGLVDALLQSGVMHEHELLGLLGLEFAHYIAPEGWQMPREAGPKADMFSLGLVLLQVLDGAQAPHRECKSLQQLSAKMLPKRGRWTPTIKAGSLYSSLPQSVRSTIEACFKCSPVERPDVEDVLFAVLSVPQALAEVAELPESPAKDLQPSSVGGIEGEAGLRSPRRSLPEKLAAAFSEGDSQVFESEGTCGRPAEDSEETSPSAGSVVNVFSADLLPTLLEASSKVSAAAPKAELADGREFAASSSPDIKRPEPTTEAPADELAQLSKYFGCRSFSFCSSNEPVQDNLGSNKEGRPSSPPQLAAQESFAVGSDQTSPPSPPRPEPPKVVHPEDWSPELAFPKDVYGAGGRRGDALLPSPPPLPPPPPPAAGRGFAARARTAGTVGRPLPPPPPPAVPHKEVFAEKPLPRVACAQGHTLKARPNEREAPAPRCTADANSSPEPEVQVPSVLDMLMPKPVLLTPSFFNHLRHSSSSYSASLHGSEVPSNRRWA
mmetsp:Transcript_109190/g.352367  ORF Transcript_109190/g.352367 Transcript_109190/m.352367 type:complete len:569 (+) Transcript_109190:1180-2886(+)